MGPVTVTTVGGAIPEKCFFGGDVRPAGGVALQKLQRLDF